MSKSKSGRTRCRPSSRCVAFIVCLGACATALADVVYLKGGDRLTGKVDSIAGHNVVLDTVFAGRLTVKLEAVERIETDEALDLRLTDGRMLTGELVTSDGIQAVAVANSAAGAILQPVELVDLRSAGYNDLAVAHVGSQWSSRADMSAAVSRGNSPTDAYSVLIESAWKRNKSEHIASLLLSQEEADGVGTKDQIEFDYGYKRFFSPKWYFAGNSEYFADQLKDIDYRVTAGGGVGYQLWDTSFGALSVEAGASMVIEKLDGSKGENPAFRWAATYNRHLWSKRLELIHNHSILVIPNRGQVFDTSTGLRLAINHRIDTSLRVDLQYETDPPPNTDKMDTTYSLGVGFKF